jgi:hypothetical protein
MPVKDKGEILKILKSQAKKRKVRHHSQSSKLKDVVRSMESGGWAVGGGA